MATVSMEVTREERLVVLRKRRAMTLKRLAGLVNTNVSTLHFALVGAPKRNIGERTRERVLSACEAILEVKEGSFSESDEQMLQEIAGKDESIY